MGRLLIGEIEKKVEGKKMGGRQRTSIFFGTEFAQEETKKKKNKGKKKKSK